MKKISKETVITRLKDQFRKWFEISTKGIEFRELAYKPQSHSTKFRVKVMGKVFRVNFLSTTETTSILSAADKLRNKLEASSEQPVLFVVPYMPPKGREKFNSYNLSWMDLSGNAHIKEPPLYIHVEGKENQFKQTGRPASVFAPEASKISLTFLLNPHRTFMVKELVDKSGVSSGTVSRVTRRLESLGFIQQERKKGRAKPYKLKNPFTMLEAWAEDYDFSRHTVIKGAIAVTRSEPFLHSLQDLLGSLGGKYSLSGPRVAEFYGIPSGSSLTVAYVSRLPPKNKLEKAKFVKGKRGSNLWLAEPNTSGVYIGSKTKRGLSVVNQIQLCLDLYSIKAQRSEELAEEVYLKIKKELKNAGF